MDTTRLDSIIDRLSKIDVSGDISNIDFNWYGDDDDVYEVSDEAYHIKVQALKRELRFLKMALSCFVTWDVSDPEIMLTLSSMDTAIKEIWDESVYYLDDLIPWYPYTMYGHQLDGKIQQCKQLIEENCHVLLNSSLRCKSLTSDESKEFLDCIVKNLKDLFIHKSDKISPLKEQIAVLQEQIELVFNFYDLIAPGRIDSKELREFKACLLNFANNAACLTFLFWTKEDANEQIMFTSKLKHIIAEMPQKITRSCAPDATALYLVAFKSIRLQGSYNTLLLGRVVAGFVDLHLKNLGAPSKVDFQVLRDGLIFLLTFLAGPPEKCEEDNKSYVDIRNDIDVVLVSDFIEQKTLDFLRKTENIIQKIRQRYVVIPNPSSYNFPNTNGLGFFDFFLQNLECLKERLKDDKNLIPIAESTIVKIEKEFVSLRPSLSDVFELQKEHKEFEDTWLHVIGLAYQTELYINLCYVDLHPAWYNMACLSYILDEIENLKSMLKKVKMYNTDDEVVGFEKEAEKIIEKLVRKHKPLAIISIVGMGGVGKTTLAQKVYGTKSVRDHFHILAFCSVSQVYNTRKLLLEILSCLIPIFGKIHSMTEADLAHELWKCLSNQKYLIVMDNMWNIEVWNKLKSSFPDHGNGSRVIFTTRLAKVALEAKSSIHELRLWSMDESLELLQKTAFAKDGCPSNFFEFGKLIAKNCGGLPLAIVLVGRLLANTPSEKWSEIVKTIGSYVFAEECRDMIGLSYKHLPEHLKACFLYFGMFGENELIKGKRLELLWIAEGFVNKPVNESYRSVAKEYLSDLVDRNLVTVVERTNRGAIKTCRLHDLIHRFCQRRAQEDNFLQLTNGHACSSFSNSRRSYRFCVCGQTDGRSFDNVELLGVSIHTLLYRRKNIGFEATIDKSKFFPSNLKVVQLLHLEGIGVRSFFEEFKLVDLVHLRYIFVSDISFIEVPESICNLWNLETFIWRNNMKTRKLPKTIWKIRRLRHVEGSDWELELGDDRRQLDNVESFSTLVLRDNRTAREILQSLPNIQNLRILQEYTNPSSPLELDFLKKLESLHLRGAEVVSVNFPETLKSLSFISCTRIPLDLIGELASLEVLKIRDLVEESWEVKDNQFRKLKYLRLRHCILNQWDASPDSFPCLEQLVVRKFTMYHIQYAAEI